MMFCFVTLTSYPFNGQWCRLGPLLISSVGIIIIIIITKEIKQGKMSVECKNTKVFLFNF